MMYPVFLNLSGKQCLVVGGGRVALRKVIALLRAKASVRVVTKEYHPRFRHIENRIELHKRPFDISDIDRSLTLIIGATDSPSINRELSSHAASLNIPCNIVDQPDLCSFIVPAIVRRGDITIAVSTGGAAPRLAKYLKSTIAQAIVPELSSLASYLSTVRLSLRDRVPSQRLRADFWESLFSVDPVTEIESIGWDAFRRKTEQLLNDYSSRIAANENK